MKKLMELKEISNYLNQYFLCVQILHDHSAKLSRKGKNLYYYDSYLDGDAALLLRVWRLPGGHCLLLVQAERRGGGQEEVQEQPVYLLPCGQNYGNFG